MNQKPAPWPSGVGDEKEFPEGTHNDEASIGADFNPWEVFYLIFGKSIRQRREA